MAKREREREPIPGTLGAVVRQLRKERGWTQEELAEKAGIDQNDVSRVETGKSQNPQDATKEAIATALGIPLGLIYERTNYPELSYQIAPLRTELKELDVDEQTMMVHLTRLYKQNKEKLAGLSEEELTAWFQFALASMARIAFALQRLTDTARQSEYICSRALARNAPKH